MKKRPHTCPRSGFSLLELMVGLCVLTVAVGAVASTLVATTNLNSTGEEIARAVEAATGVLEELRAEEFPDLFALRDGDPGNDPGGPGSAPGSDFAVRGLAPWDGAATVGTIEFPGNGGELREDVVDRDLGMPRDLNGDGVIDGEDHSDDYIVLPVRVRVRWQGRSGRVERSLVHVLAEF